MRYIIERCKHPILSEQGGEERFLANRYFLTGGAAIDIDDRGFPAAAAALRGVHKRFGATEALRGIDLDVPFGEIVALLGPNGAGKTTAIGVLLGLRRPDRGEATVLGNRPGGMAARREIGVTPQRSQFPGNLRVREIVDLVRVHFSAPAPCEELLSRFGLDRLSRRQTGGLSGGEARRLAVALAFAGNPRLVFLDEPTTGLDVESRRDVWRATRDYVDGGGTVLLTTHYLEEAEALAHRVAVMNAGQVVAAGRPDEIKGRVALKRVRLRAAALPDLLGVARAEEVDGVHTLYTNDADALVRALVTSGAAFADLEVLPASLEEAFVALTEGAQ